jgi:cation transport regulator ChaB
MKNYNMIIYTASDQSYADSVMSYIDPTQSYFKFKMYRHNCVKMTTDNGTIYVKDLRIIRNVPLSNMVIIDNSVLSFAFHLENGIPIIPYYSNKDDVELTLLKNYLTKLAKYDNLTIQNGLTLNLKGVLEETIQKLKLEAIEAEKNPDKNNEKQEKIEKVTEKKVDVAKSTVNMNFVKDKEVSKSDKSDKSCKTLNIKPVKDVKEKDTKEPKEKENKMYQTMIENQKKMK